MNPSKAPWYFLGLQEMLVYFDPWMAGVVLPSLILVGLMAIPYMDANPLGNGYYTYKQRKFAILSFCFGFLHLVAVDGGHWNLYSRPGLDLVLAGANLGSQPGGVRGQPRFAGYLRNHQRNRQGNLRGNCDIVLRR